MHQMEASGWAPELDTPEKRQAFMDQEWNERGIRIDPDKVCKNEAKRTIAKLTLNSMCEFHVLEIICVLLRHRFFLGGKLCENPDKLTKEFADEERLFMINTNPNIRVQDSTAYEDGEIHYVEHRKKKDILHSNK